MNEKIDAEIVAMKAEIAEWPRDQRGSLVSGIVQGLALAALMAKEAGFNIANESNFVGLTTFLIQNMPSVKKRDPKSEAAAEPRDQMVDDIKQLLRKAIAARLRIPKPRFDTSLDANELVDKYFTIVVAIGNRTTLDDAIRDIRIVRSVVGGGRVDHETVRAEVELCYDQFKVEIAAVERFNELTKRSGFKPKEVWVFLRSNVWVDWGYDDDELHEIDARYR